MAAVADDLTSVTETVGGTKMPVKKEYVFKVVVVGDYSVGKTTFIQRLLRTRAEDSGAGGEDPDEDLADESDGEAQDPAYDPNDETFLKKVTPTIGADFYSKLVKNVMPRKHVRLQLWDTAGLERYAAVHASTYRNASLVVCLFDATEKKTLESVVNKHLMTAAEYVPELDQGSIFVVGNKIDLFGGGAAQAKALQENHKRAESPETAFCEEDDERTDTSARGTGPAPLTLPTLADRAVSQSDLHHILLELFPDVHYAEVSAYTKTGMSELLLRLCVALLYKEGAMDGEVTADDFKQLSDEALEFSALPKTEDAATVTKSSAEASPRSVDSTQVNRSKIDPYTSPPSPGAATPAPTPALAAAVPPAEKMAPLPPPAAAAPAAKPAVPTPAQNGSWRNSSAFSFDMAPATLNSTLSHVSGIFSPKEGTDDNQRAGPAATPPAAGAAKQTADAPSLAGLSKKEREKAEMDALLGRSKGKPGAAEGGGKSPAAARPKGAAPPGDLDGMETTVTIDVDGTVTGSGTNRRAFRSVLNDAAEERERKREPVAKEDSDEDGVRFKENINERYDGIHHDAFLKEEAAKREANLMRLYGKKGKDKKPPSVNLSKSGGAKEKKKKKCKC